MRAAGEHEGARPMGDVLTDVFTTDELEQLTQRDLEILRDLIVTQLRADDVMKVRKAKALPVYNKLLKKKK
jgi:hypothetical protein